MLLSKDRNKLTDDLHKAEALDAICKRRFNAVACKWQDYMRELFRTAKFFWFFFYYYHHSSALYIKMDLKILSPVPTTKVKNDRMDVDEEAVHLVNPGETVTTDQQFMRYITLEHDMPTIETHMLCRKIEVMAPTLMEKALYYLLLPVQWKESTNCCLSDR